VVLAEIGRVLRNGGRLAAVSMAKVKPGEGASMLERTYIWMHRHFPHIVDCRPIDLAALLAAAGFHVLKKTGVEIWTMPVAAVLAGKGSVSQ
jgi:demethylmenaquinone methyltransferase/2-methoxy-6-polyprenyl-1,4-benzoquinol methylase